MNVVYYNEVTVSTNDKFICFLPPFVFKPNFQLLALLETLKFDSSFRTGRRAILFGDKPYGYGNVLHMPVSITENPYIHEMFKFILKLFPSFGLNSCLINYYPDPWSYMPDHSDNEHYIEPLSFIVTISLGSTRKIFFKNSMSGAPLASVAVVHGDILIFSKESQSRFTHGIPSVNYSSNSFLPRISATFRRLRDV